MTPARSRKPRVVELLRLGAVHPHAKMVDYKVAGFSRATFQLALAWRNTVVEERYGRPRPNKRSPWPDLKVGVQQEILRAAAAAAERRGVRRGRR